MKFGAVALVPVQGKFIALECVKGRGVILPGGNVEPNETAKQASQRELIEETGLTPIGCQYLYDGPHADGFHCHTFIVNVREIKIGEDFGSGKVILADWPELLKSHFRGYYEILQDIVENRKALAGALTNLAQMR